MIDLKHNRSFLLFLPVLFFGQFAKAQVTVENALTPQELVEQVLVGGGVQVFNVTYNGQANVVGGQQAIGSFESTNTILPLETGLVLASGGVTQIPQGAPWSAGSGAGSDPDLVMIASGNGGNSNIFDKSVLEFDFIPTGDTISFRYIFASTEYQSFTCTQYNDAFGFFLSGPGINGPFSNNAINLATIPNTNVPITVNTVNGGAPTGGGQASTCALADPNWQANSIYYVNNQPPVDIMFNGLTVVLTAWAEVVCGQTYHIKLAIGDAADSGLDSGVFLEGGSFSSTGQVIPELAGGIGVDGNTMMEGCGPFELVFTRLGDLSEEATITLTAGGTAVLNTDYSPAIPGEIFFPANVETVSFWLNVPVTGAGPRTLQIDILQLIACANQNLLTTFIFNIESPMPLALESYDINSTCGQSHILDPQVQGGMGAYVYAWSNGATTPTIEVTPGVTTTYQLTVSDGCEVLDEMVEYTITLPIYDPLEVVMGPDVAIDCLGSGEIEVISVTGGDNTFTYEWTLDGGVVGTGPVITVPASQPVWYVVTITEGCGATIQDSLMVSTVPLDPVEITTSGDVTVICPGDSTIMAITGVTGGNGVFTYLWHDQNGQPLTSNTNFEVWVTADHTYTITATDQCLNQGTTTITTFLPVYDQFLLKLPADRMICAGDSLSIFAQVTGGSGYYYLDWQNLAHTDPILDVSPWYDTQYTVTAIDRCGEQRTDRMVVQVEHVSVDIVEANWGQDDWYLQAATTPYALTWVWDMGDGTRYRTPEVVHSYVDLEEHWVTLRITTPNGCLGMDSLLLRPPAHVYFPNAFTPDGDGHNDLFGPVGHYITEMEMEIFDRWGNLIFVTNSMDQWWDGTVGGSTKAQTGVYVYKYRVKGHYFPAKEGYGHVTLLQGSLEY